MEIGLKADVWVDGGGNVGTPGSAACVVKTNDDVFKKSKKLPVEVSNNVAEYEGLILGLQLALDVGVSVAKFYSDSKLIVGQVQSIWKVREPSLVLLRLTVWDLAEKFDSVEIAWIRRNHNKEADRLCREVLKPPKLSSGRKRPEIDRNFPTN